MFELRALSPGMNAWSLAVCCSIPCLFSCVSRSSANDVQNNGRLAPLAAPSTRISGALIHAFRKPPGGCAEDEACPVPDDAGQPCTVAELENGSCVVSILCSGAIVREPLLSTQPIFLTAAHCVDNAAEDARVYLPAQGVLLNTSGASVHPDWAEEKKFAPDLGFFQLSPADRLNGLEVGSIETTIPSTPHTAETRAVFEQGGRENIDGITRAVQDFDLNLFRNFPALTIVGFGVAEKQRSFEVRTLSGLSEADCRGMGANAENVLGQNPDHLLRKVRWSVEMGVCVGEFERFRDILHKNPLRARFVTKTAASYFDLRSADGPQIGDRVQHAVAHAPHPDRPLESTCSADSGAPLFLDPQSRAVFGVHFMGVRPCAGSVGLAFLVRPFLEEWKAALERERE